MENEVVHLRRRLVYTSTNKSTSRTVGNVGDRRDGESQTGLMNGNTLTWKPSIHLQWFAPFFSGGGYSSEAISYIQELRKWLHLGIEQHGDSINAQFVNGLPVELQRTLAELRLTTLDPARTVQVFFILCLVSTNCCLCTYYACELAASPYPRMPASSQVCVSTYMNAQTRHPRALARTFVSMRVAHLRCVCACICNHPCIHHPSLLTPRPSSLVPHPSSLTPGVPQ